MFNDLFNACTWLGIDTSTAMDTLEVRGRIHEVRQEELARSAEIIGYDQVELLGYRDSGMPDSEENAHPDNFANAPLSEAVGKLVEIIRRERADVIITYGDDQSGYPHPDHLRVHDISLPAFEAAGDPTAYPEAGEPFAPSKLYYVVWSRARIQATHEKFVELGIESPFGEDWFKRPSQDDQITTSIEIGDFFDVRLDSLLAHATQVDPTSPFWFGLPREVSRTVHPFDDYILARSRVDSELPESDLFAGLR